VIAGAWDAIKHRDDVARVQIGLLDRRGQQCPREGDFPDTGPLGQPRQPRGVLRIERDV